MGRRRGFQFQAIESRNGCSASGVTSSSAGVRSGRFRDVDQESTFVGGTEPLIQALIADPDLAAWPALASYPITAGSDTINR